MKIHLVSLGCARNTIDSEVMLGCLKRAGSVIVDDPAEAEAVVVNTCSFIEPAVNESIDTILELARLKKEGRCRRLVVTGCLPERYRRDIVSALPEVDVFLGTGAFDRIADAVEGDLAPATCILPDPDSLSLVETPDARVRPAGPSAYLKIAEGCSKHCTYCIIPKLRGKQKSRPPANILAEARWLIQNGVREIVLVSQDTTAYGSDLAPDINLAGLLEGLAGLAAEAPPAGDRTGNRCWIRFMYGHPESIDADVIKTVARHSNLCSYFDIPIQHAADAVLKKMGRRYSQQDLHGLIDRIRTQVPEAVIRTTVIVGFPGESDADFDALLDFIETVQFDHLGCFVYSDSEDLPSHRLPAPVSGKVARKRHNALMARQKTISTARNRRYVGQALEILVEEQIETGVYAGRTAFQAPEVDGLTYIHAEALPVGQFATAASTDSFEYDLIGRC
jgi:ribosomal protein S12 methylthiotransferase